MKPYRITIHCSATKDGQRCPASEITKWHKKRGFITIGYHGVIQPNGDFERGRGLNVKGAHVKNENEGNIGLCLIGDTRYSLAQFSTLRYHLDALFMLYDIEPWDLYCHYQFESAVKQSKTCPNININKLLIWYYHSDESAIAEYLI